jgi:hypothetical protein
MGFAVISTSQVEAVAAEGGGDKKGKKHQARTRCLLIAPRHVSPSMHFDVDL